MRFTKGPRIPAVVACQNPACSRDRLDPSVYQAPVPDGTPEAIVHRAAGGETPFFSVACPQCGHYSVFVPRAQVDMMERLKAK